MKIITSLSIKKQISSYHALHNMTKTWRRTPGDADRGDADRGGAGRRDIGTRIPKQDKVTEPNSNTTHSNGTTRYRKKSNTSEEIRERMRFAVTNTDIGEVAESTTCRRAKSDVLRKHELSADEKEKIIVDKLNAVPLVVYEWDFRTDSCYRTKSYRFRIALPAAASADDLEVVLRQRLDQIRHGLESIDHDVVGRDCGTFVDGRFVKVKEKRVSDARLLMTLLNSAVLQKHISLFTAELDLQMY